MTLRESLGGDVRRIHELIETLLDREDGVLVFFDGRRVVTYAEGFGASASQLELLGVELERALHKAVGRRRPGRRRNHERHQGILAVDRVDGHHHGPADGVLRLASKVA
jgi:hypothetical protein